MPSSKFTLSQAGLRSLKLDHETNKSNIDSLREDSRLARNVDSIKEDSQAAPLDLMDEILPAKNKFQYVEPFQV